MILFKLILVFHLFSNTQILNICYIPCTYMYMVQVHDLWGILSYKFSTLTYEQDENIYHDVSCSHNFSRGGGANKTLTFTIKVLARNTKVLLKMLCNSETDRGSKTSQILYLSLFLFCISVQLTSCVSDTSYNATTTMLTNNTSNNSVGDDL